MLSLIGLQLFLCFGIAAGNTGGADSLYSTGGIVTDVTRNTTGMSGDIQLWETNNLPLTLLRGLP
jgi:hypothetical protein